MKDRSMREKALYVEGNSDSTGFAKCMISYFLGHCHLGRRHSSNRTNPTSPENKIREYRWQHPNKEISAKIYRTKSKVYITIQRWQRRVQNRNWDDRQLLQDTFA